MNLKFFSKATLYIALASTALFSCQKTSLNDLDGGQSLKASLKPSPAMTCGNYEVVLATPVFDGVNTTFTWTVTNLNPGNGSGSTSQNLSHWVMTLCQRAAENIVSVSDANGVQGPASYIVDNSQSCTNTPVLKFNYGTNGGTPTTYTAVFSGNFGVGTMSATFKAGTACCTMSIDGVSCDEIGNPCSYSQGYWFANAAHNWGRTVTLGGHTYTQAEGQALWAAHPGGSGGTATKVFYQASAIILSIPTANIPAALAADIATIDAALTGLGKLTAANHPNVTDANAVTAAAHIAAYICLYHCGSPAVDPGACAPF